MAVKPDITGIPDHDGTIDTAKKGGIRSIKRFRSLAKDEAYIYIIRGVLLPPMKKRKNFQNSTRYFQIGEIGLSDDWELAHLWPPRFGDESAAGIMAAPKELNQSYQNHKVERWIQSLRTKYVGGPIEVIAAAACWDNHFLMSKGNPDYGKTEILKWVSYTISDGPKGATTPAGTPLLNTSVTLELKPPTPGVLPTVIPHGTASPLHWM